MASMIELVLSDLSQALLARAIRRKLSNLSIISQAMETSSELSFRRPIRCSRHDHENRPPKGAGCSLGGDAKDNLRSKALSI